MEKWKSLISDGLILASLAAYSYFLFIMNAKGYFAAFGLFNSTGLIPLEIQNVIPSVVSTLLITALFFVILLSVIGAVSYLTKSKSKRITEIARSIVLIIAPLLFMSPIFYGTYLEDKHQLWVIAITYVLVYVVVFVILPLIEKTQLNNKNGSLIISTIDKLLNKLNIPESSRLILTTILLFVVMLPLSAYSYGYISARRQSDFYSVKSDGSTYLVVKEYGNEAVLAEYTKNALLSHYKVVYLDGEEILSFNTIQIKNLNFNNVRGNTVQRGLIQF